MKIDSLVIMINFPSSQDYWMVTIIITMIPSDDYGHDNYDGNYDGNTGMVYLVYLLSGRNSDIYHISIWLHGFVMSRYSCSLEFC